MSYGENKLRAEYWLGADVDELYRFIHSWTKHLYGEMDEQRFKGRGFERIPACTEWTQSAPTKAGLGGFREDG
ncbi:GL10263 [Drosophila persimilis]|uniref:GL10263 n=1 Tax=Drosophila persimilis TaxID=7234 RepID=B4ISG2_DROPE|nr:GL10263 [Drosophila persimilis]